MEKIIINSKRYFELQDYEGEFWKEIKDYEDNYKISNYGRIKSIKGKDNKEKILKPYLNKKNGYYLCALCNNGKVKQKLVHRIVYYTFNNCEETDVIDHIDGNKYNNKLDNLQNITQKQNVKKYYNYDKKKRDFIKKIYELTKH